MSDRGLSAPSPGLPPRDFVEGSPQLVDLLTLPPDAFGPAAYALAKVYRNTGREVLERLRGRDVELERLRARWAGR